MRVGSQEAGLTLMEMLVVLAIVGVMAGATMLGLGAIAGGPGAEGEARRLAARLRLAADEALVTDRAIALASDERGYGFVLWDGARRRWASDPVDALGERHELAAGLTMTTDQPRSPAPIDANRTLTASIADGAERWQVRFDGLTAQAERVAAP